MALILTDTETGETVEVTVCFEDGTVHESRFFCPICVRFPRED
jgi:hypothetical protein